MNAKEFIDLMDKRPPPWTRYTLHGGESFYVGVDGVPVDELADAAPQMAAAILRLLLAERRCMTEGEFPHSEGPGNGGLNDQGQCCRDYNDAYFALLDSLPKDLRP